jgi:feruloyl esterase
MPTVDWNGKFQAVGNGGLAGSISFADMQTAVSRNYATASTDTGHWLNAPGDPWWTNAQQIKDYGYRSIRAYVEGQGNHQRLYGSDPERPTSSGA